MNPITSCAASLSKRRAELAPAPFRKSSKAIGSILQSLLLLASLSIPAYAEGSDDPSEMKLKLSKCAQNYPERAQREEATGVTKVRISVDPDGNVKDVEVIRPAGPTKAHRDLDRATVALFKCLSPFKKTNAAYSFENEYRWTLR